MLQPYITETNGTAVMKFRIVITLYIFAQKDISGLEKIYNVIMKTSEG